MKPSSAYIAYSSSDTTEPSSSRARTSARRSRPGSYAGGGSAARSDRRRLHRSASAGPKATTARAPRTISEVATTSVNRRRLAGRRRPALCPLESRRNRAPWWPRAGGRPPSEPPPTSQGRAGGETPRSGALSPATSGSPSASRTSPCPGFMRTSFIWAGLWQRSRAAQSEHVDGSDPGAEVLEPVADRLGSDLPSPARRVRELATPSQKSRERRGMRTARSVRSAVRVARALDPQGARAVEEHVSAIIGMSPGDDHGFGPQRLDCLGELLRGGPASQPGELDRLGQVGRRHGGARQHPLD